MRLALDAAYAGIKQNAGGPFGCCLVIGGEVAAVAHNSVLKDKDPTAHAEINAIREATKKLKHFHLKDAAIFSTSEPCPMCYSAIHWAQIGKIYFGSPIVEVQKIGFNEMPISGKTLKELSGGKIEIHPGVMLKECQQLLEFYKTIPGAQRY